MHTIIRQAVRMLLFRSVKCVTAEREHLIQVRHELSLFPVTQLFMRRYRLHARYAASSTTMLDDIGCCSSVHTTHAPCFHELQYWMPLVEGAHSGDKQL